MKSKITNKIISFTVLFSLFVMSGVAYATGTETMAGTSIVNSATLSYAALAAPSVAIDPITSSVTFKVDRKINMIVTRLDAAPLPVVAGQANVALAFSVTNIGNSQMSFRLTPSSVLSGDVGFPPALAAGVAPYSNIRICRESGSNSGFQPLEDLPIDITLPLPIDASEQFYLVVDINPLASMPDMSLNPFLGFTVVAEAVDSSRGTAAYTGNNVLDAVGVYGLAPDVLLYNVFADGPGPDDGLFDGKASVRSAYKYVSTLVSITKTQRVIWDPINLDGAATSTSPHFIPGALVQYEIKVQNALGAAPAKINFISDVLDSNVTFDPDYKISNLNTGMPAPAVGGGVGKGFEARVIRMSLGSSLYYTTAPDADGLDLTGSTITADCSKLLPVSAVDGYGSGELKPGDELYIKFNVYIK